MTEENTTPALTGEPAARADAVKVAAKCLGRRTGVSTEFASAWEVIALADYIITGDPADLDMTEGETRDVTDFAIPWPDAPKSANIYMSYGGQAPAYALTIDHGKFLGGLRDLAMAIQGGGYAAAAETVGKFLGVLGVRVNTTLDEEK